MFDLDSQPLKLLYLSPSLCTASLGSVSPDTILVLCHIHFAFPVNYFDFFSPSVKKGQKGELLCIGNQHYFPLHLRPAAKHNKHIQLQQGTRPADWSKKEKGQKRKYSGNWERMPGCKCAVFCAEQQRGAAERRLSGCTRAAPSSRWRSPQTGSLVLGRC